MVGSGGFWNIVLSDESTHGTLTTQKKEPTRMRAARCTQGTTEHSAPPVEARYSTVL